MFRQKCTFNVAALCAPTSRSYASVSSSIIVQPPPPPQPPTPARPIPTLSNTPYLDSQVVKSLSLRPQNTLPDLIKHYIDRAGSILNVSLPYESRPTEARRLSFTDPASSKEVVTIAHCVKHGSNHKITLSSGFTLNAPADQEGETLIVTCAHTLEEIRQSPLLLREEEIKSPSSQMLTGTFVCIGAETSMKVYPVSSIVSALPRSDILLLSCPLPAGVLNTLPASPYPVHRNAPIRAHFVAQTKPIEPGWTPWIGDTWGKWVKGNVLGYRDFAGRETEPGTYDALSHLLFTPVPTAGSSGGPIVDEESGAVIGVMLGTRMDNRVEGVRGWGVPSETVFEMFTLPGLKGKN